MKSMTNDVRADDVAVHDLAAAARSMRLALAAVAADPGACEGAEVVIAFGDPVRLRLERTGRVLVAPPQSAVGPALVSEFAAAAMAYAGLALGKLSPVATERVRGLLAAGAALEVVVHPEAVALRVVVPTCNPVTLVRTEAV
jgi:hypothetical protein